MRRWAASLAIILAVAACDHSISAPLADRIEVISGAAQTGGQGAELSQPIVVRVLDRDGKPLAGVHVEWRTIAGGGYVADAATVTDADGRAQAKWSLGVAIGQNLLFVSAGSATITIVAQGARQFSVTAAGGQHSCGLTTVGDLYCWGDNSAGQLGDGTGIVSPRATPARVLSPLRFSAVTAASAHTCALAQTGEAYCWGGNSDGQLGVNNYAIAGAPLPVAGNRTYISISAGYIHTCAVATNGDLYCWGSNVYRQLGNGTLDKSNIPVLVSTTLKFKSVSAGEFHTCALATNDVAYCWGWNSAGELGTGAEYGAIVAQPTAVAGGLTFNEISAGVRHTCAVGKADNAAYCWGRSATGEIGTAPFDHRRTPFRLTVATLFSHISAAGNVQSCGTAVGTVYCWGSDTFNLNPQPAAVFGPGAYGLSVGFNHACAVQNGELWCWGANDHLQLGITGRPGSAQPVKVVVP